MFPISSPAAHDPLQFRCWYLQLINQFFETGPKGGFLELEGQEIK